MKNIDAFDGFLRNNFLKAKLNIADDGFTKKVLRNLPMVEHPLRRYLILYLACLIAVFIFVISSGYRSLFMAMIDIFSNGVNLTKPSAISLVVVAVFTGASICIARIEYEGNI